MGVPIAKFLLSVAFPIVLELMINSIMKFLSQLLKALKTLCYCMNLCVENYDIFAAANLTVVNLANNCT